MQLTYFPPNYLLRGWLSENSWSDYLWCCFGGRSQRLLCWEYLTLVTLQHLRINNATLLVG